uniref:CTNNB1_binding domain-containing protein n=1 Tax=Globodera pallida TaxID=36090 RepID=A0A183CSE1_GLOPA
MANMEDEVSFGSDEHEPASNGAAAAGSVSVTVSEDNVRTAGPRLQTSSSALVISFVGSSSIVRRKFAITQWQWVVC